MFRLSKLFILLLNKESSCSFLFFDALGSALLVSIKFGSRVLIRTLPLPGGICNTRSETEQIAQIEHLSTQSSNIPILLTTKLVPCVMRASSMGKREGAFSNHVKKHQFHKRSSSQLTAFTIIKNKSSKRFKALRKMASSVLNMKIFCSLECQTGQIKRKKRRKASTKIDKPSDTLAPRKYYHHNLLAKHLVQLHLCFSLSLIIF